MPTYTVECSTCKKRETVFRHLDEHGQWPKCCRRKMRQVLGKFSIIKDIEPYRAVGYDVATGHKPIITSRAHHRQYLKNNGYEEVGNELPKTQGMPGDKLDSPRAEIVKNLKKATGRPV